MNINLTLIGQLIMFIMFVFFCKKYIWHSLVESMEDRKRLIEKSLSKAKESEKSLQRAQIEALNIIINAKKQSSKIITTSESQAKNIITDAEAKAITSAKKIKSDAKEESDKIVGLAKIDLVKDYENLVVLGVKKIINKEISKDTHVDILSKMKEEIVV